MANHEDPEDILGTSLQSLYGYEAITVSSAGSVYTCAIDGCSIKLKTPDVDASNWALHASSIWASSVFLASNLGRLNLTSLMGRKGTGKPVTVLELGAGAGLPGIMIAKMYGDVEVVVSDYPDVKLIETLTENIMSNDVSKNCRSIGHDWGSPLSAEWKPAEGFDVIVAADTIWNPELHGLFLGKVDEMLTHDNEGRVYIVAGLHTGRYTIERFIKEAQKAGLQKGLVREVTRDGDERDWRVDRTDAEEDRSGRWLVWLEFTR